MKKIFALFAMVGILLVSCSDDESNRPNTADCDLVSEVITEEDFHAINTSNYSVTDVQLNGNCLGITIGSSGCDSDLWSVNLYSTNAFYSVFPIQRAVKIELINEQLCEAFFRKTIYFDLESFQIKSQDEILLNIEGWSEQIRYKY